MQWREIHGYHYSVSEDGRVRNDKTGRVLKQFLSGGRIERGDHVQRYQTVQLWNQGNRKNFLVHRLVAMAFVERPSGPEYYQKNEVNHLDSNPGNNHWTNLEWCSRYENEHHKLQKEQRDHEQQQEKQRFETFMSAHLDILQEIEGVQDEAV
jgi:hypothetical protein